MLFSPKQDTPAEIKRRRTFSEQILTYGAFSEGLNFNWHFSMIWAAQSQHLQRAGSRAFAEFLIQLRGARIFTLNIHGV
jgi:hypothetical protein